VKSVLLGSVSARLVRRSPIPAVVVPRPDSEAEHPRETSEGQRRSTATPNDDARQAVQASG
jgi:hypothetical protein